MCLNSLKWHKQAINRGIFIKSKENTNIFKEIVGYLIKQTFFWRDRKLNKLKVTAKKHPSIFL